MLVHSGAGSIAEDCPFAEGIVAAAATPPVDEAVTELAMKPSRWIYRRTNW